jgi:WD40 repeat protein
MSRPIGKLPHARKAHSAKTPEVYAVSRGPSGGWSLSRRSLLGAASAAAAVPQSVRAGPCAQGAYPHFTAAPPASLAVSPDGKLLVSGSSGGEGPSSNAEATLKLWSLPGGALLRTIKAQSGSVRSLAMSPDGRFMAFTGSGSVSLWSFPEGTPLKTLPGRTPLYGVSGVGISADGRYLAATNSVVIHLWSLPDTALLKTFTSRQGATSCLAFSPDGRLLISGGGALTLWSLPDGAQIKTLTGHAGFVDAVAVSPNGRLLASGGYDKTIKLWSLPDGALLRTLTGHASAVYAVAISPDGRLLASGSADDHAIKLWSLPDGALLKTLNGHSDQVNAVVISPDGGFLVSCSRDNSIRLWSLPDGQALPICLMDPAWSGNWVNASRYDLNGVSYAVPGGFPLPPGAVCTCNTVPGSVSPGSGGGGIYYYPN